jgi:hypothetical protein
MGLENVEWIDLAWWWGQWDSSAEPAFSITSKKSSLSDYNILIDSAPTSSLHLHVTAIWQLFVVG